MWLQNSRNIFLVGPTATGKTTLGRYMARKLRLKFGDSDQAIEDAAGTDIEWIFDVEGEEGFREREEKAIEELTSGQGLLLATGAGAVLREANRRHLAERGLVVFLDTSIDIQLERAKKGRKRPLLGGQDMREVLTRMRAERTPLYEEIADVSFFVEIKGPKLAARKLLAHLAEQGYPGKPGSTSEEKP